MEYKILSARNFRVFDMIVFDRMQAMQQVRQRLAEGWHALVIRDDSEVVYSDTPDWPYLFDGDFPSADRWINEWTPTFTDASGDVSEMFKVNLDKEDHLVQIVNGLIATEQFGRKKEQVPEYLNRFRVNSKLFRSGYLTTMGYSKGTTWSQPYPKRLEKWLNCVFAEFVIFSNQTITIL